jgi:NADPH-dependent curcumin reductase CurA
MDFLPTALAKGTYRPAPDAMVVGEGLDKIPDALEQLQKGVSAKKLVVKV